MGALRRTIGFGILALGCMRKYVRKVQSEIGYLESRLALAVMLLLQQLKIQNHQNIAIECNNIVLSEINVGDSDIDIDNTIGKELIDGELVHTDIPASTNVLSTSTTHTISTHQLSDIIISESYLNSFHWALKNDSRVIDLLNAACPIRSVPFDSGISPSSSSLERRILEDLLAHLKESCTNITFICRAVE